MAPSRIYSKELKDVDGRIGVGRDDVGIYSKELKACVVAVLPAILPVNL